MLSGESIGNLVKKQAVTNVVTHPIEARLRIGATALFTPSTFTQILKQIDRSSFSRSVRESGSDKYRKSFKTWDHLVVMLFSQFSGAKSLRDIEVGFNSHNRQHFHIGSRFVSRSTLSDANASRPYEPFKMLAQNLMSSAGRKLKKDAKELLYALDATSVTLKGQGFDTWTKDNKNHNTQGIKLHLALNINENFPASAVISAPNVNDVSVGNALLVGEKSTYVFDKGYCDYNWWWQIHQNGGRFVTRIKKNAAIRLKQENLIPEAYADQILEDVWIELKNKNPRAGKKNYYSDPLRRITVKRGEGASPIVLISNDLESPANEISELYKKRWKVEVFFRWLKQTLKVKRYLGRNENAVKIQIYTALIAYLLVYQFKKLSKALGSLRRSYLFISFNLFAPSKDPSILYKPKLKKQLDSLQMGLNLCL